MECHLLKQSACFISFQTREGLGARKFSFCIGIEFVLYYHSTERETQKEKKKKKKKKQRDRDWLCKATPSILGTGELAKVAS